MNPLYIVGISSILFMIGILVMLTRKNILAMLMGAELMLNAVNLNFVVFDRQHSGEIFALFVIVVAVAETALALAIFYKIYKHFKQADISKIQ